MPSIKMLRELLDTALSISDDYVRTVTLAKAGYYLKDMDRDMFSEVFKSALKSLDHISSPVLRTRAMIEVAREMDRSGLRESGGKLLYRAYELTGRLPEPIRDNILIEIVKTATKIGLLQDAVMYAFSIEDRDTRMEALAGLVSPLLNTGDFRRVKKILDVLEEPWKSEAATKIAEKYLSKEQFASVLTILPYVEDIDLLRKLFRDIGIHLKKASVPEGTYEKFIEAAKALADRDEGIVFELLSTIASTGRSKMIIKALAEMKYPIKGILMVVNRIIDRPEVITEFVKLIDIPQDKAETMYKFIMDLLLRREASEQYKELVGIIGRKTESEGTLVKVIRYMTKLNDIGEAYRLASLIEDVRLRSLAFGSVAMALIRKGDMDSAIDAVREVKDERWSSWLMGEIILKILQLYSGKDINENFEESSKEQEKRWNEDAKSGGDRWIRT